MQPVTTSDKCRHINNEGAEHFGLDPFNAQLLDLLSQPIALKNKPGAGGEPTTSTPSNGTLQYEYPLVWHWAEDIWSVLKYEDLRDMKAWSRHLQNVKKMRTLVQPVPLLAP
eukprot:g7767.t1